MCAVPRAAGCSFLADVLFVPAHPVHPPAQSHVTAAAHKHPRDPSSAAGPKCHSKAQQAEKNDGMARSHKPLFWLASVPPVPEAACWCCLEMFSGKSHALTGVRKGWGGRKGRGGPEPWKLAMMRKLPNKQTNKQTSKRANKQANRQTDRKNKTKNKQTNKQASKQNSRVVGKSGVKNDLKVCKLSFGFDPLLAFCPQQFLRLRTAIKRCTRAPNTGD